MEIGKGDEMPAVGSSVIITGLDVDVVLLKMICPLVHVLLMYRLSFGCEMDVYPLGPLICISDMFRMVNVVVPETVRFCRISKLDKTGIVVSVRPMLVPPNTLAYLYCEYV